jgi:hypothetical protein
MNNKWTSIVTALALCVGMSGIALAQDWGQDRDRYYNGGYNQPYGYYSRDGYLNRAERFGYRDGLIDGRNDAATGHSFRPTYDHSFRNATNGYVGGYGDLREYRQTYRQAYTRGYQAGYTQNRSGRWGW